MPDVDLAISGKDGLFARMVEALPAAVVISDKKGEIRLINRLATNMFGYDATELRGRSVDLLLPERFRGRHAGHREGFLADLSSRAMAGDLPIFGLRKDGGEFPADIGLSSLELNGEAMVISVIADTGPQRRIESERARVQGELERSNADLEEFAYAASHDLMAPLRAIGHLAEWVRADIAPIAGAETMTNLTLLQGRVTRLKILLDGLLAYSRLGRSEHDAEDVDIGELIRDVSAMLELPPGFEIVCEGEMLTIRTYRSPIQMVLKNLISNGVQHHDRTEGRVTVSMRMLDRMVEFRVSDDGPGIPEQFHQRIFVIFETLKSRDVKESTGIGLAIVKKKVESNGGLIRLESVPPARGSTFIFTWSLA